jgi:hypothetical protein
MNSDLPTGHDYLKSNVHLLIWCKACRHQREIGFQTIIDQGKGRVPVAHLKFVCTNCGSRLTDCVVSGSHRGEGLLTWRGGGVHSVDVGEVLMTPASTRASNALSDSPSESMCRWVSPSRLHATVCR